MSEIYRPHRIKQENYQAQDVKKKGESNPIAIDFFEFYVVF